MKVLKSFLSLILVFGIIFTCVLFASSPKTGAATGTKIHFIALPEHSDAILLESNGKFAMVDSGEDTDYPSGNNNKYPFRSGTTTKYGFEDIVIGYLNKLGVKTLEFYIGTHAHSDHIGSGAKILNTFAVKKLYLAEYSDSYISDSNRLWDNLYIYDNLLAAAKKNNTQVIQKFNAQNTVFDMGDMHIEILNYDRARYSSGKIIPVRDDNENSLGVKITANNKTAFLAGDIEENDEIKNGYALANQIGSNIDIYKPGHHGLKTSNELGFVSRLSPKNTIITGSYTNLRTDTRNYLYRTGCKIYAAPWYVKTSGVIVANMASSGVQIEAKNGWMLDGGKWCYLDSNSDKVKNDWTKVNGTWYYFDSSGVMISNTWKEVNNKWYYLDKDGKMQTGWLNLNSSWYYLDSSGAMKTGLITVSGKQYYLNSNGVMLTGWQQLNDNWYYFDSSAGGAAKTSSWLKDKNKWYYLGSDAVMKTGWITDAGKKYYLESSGAMLTGLISVGGKKYYMDSSGAMKTGWVKDGSTWYYFDSLLNGSAKLNGWLKDNNKWYYLGADGAMKTGWITVSGKKYYLESSGAMLTGLINSDGKKYFADSSGAMQTGWIQYGNDWYYFDSAIDGAAKTNSWQVSNSKWYYLGADGIMQTGLITVSDGRKYFLDASGAMKTGWVKVDNDWYYFDTTIGGAAKTGWLSYGGKWYYLDQSSGIMLCNTSRTIAGVLYKFNSSGAMI